jgi:hypothetical protein
MATTTLTATAITKNTAQAFTQGTGTAINADNTMKVLYPKEGKLLILIDSDHASTAATFAVSDEFTAKGQGVLTEAVADTTMDALILESARFKKADGYVYWTWATNSAGYVQVYTLPD